MSTGDPPGGEETEARLPLPAPPVQDPRLRQLLVLRMLLLAWKDNTRAPWRSLVREAIEYGAQYDPPVTQQELAALRPHTIEELFDPAAVARRARRGPRHRPERSRT